MKNVIVYVLLHLVHVATQTELRNLDNNLMLNIFRRRISTAIFRSTKRAVETEKNRRVLRLRNKLQPIVDDSVPFICTLNNSRSFTKPLSVHELRPGDIDVIGAFGDSLSVGAGLTATNVFQVYFENRGISPSAGGMGTWREYFTLPNILKEFNPNLIGYAKRPAMGSAKDAVFNVAAIGAISADIPHMAKILIRRIRSHPKLDFEKDWKLITFMIGPNDFCTNICYQNEEVLLENHRNDLIQTLRILRDNLPRVFISLVLAPNLKTLIEFVNRPRRCRINHLIVCPCLIGERFKKNQDRYINLMRRWQEIELEVANMCEFDTDTFTVVAQPFTENLVLPTTSDGTTDYSYLSEDCFHFSQKGNTFIVNSLWNNMLEPVGNKSTKHTNLFERFNCPTSEHPYLFTRRNSFVDCSSL